MLLMRKNALFIAHIQHISYNILIHIVLRLHTFPCDIFDVLILIFKYAKYMRQAFDTLKAYSTNLLTHEIRYAQSAVHS